jgi:hypothetical protein
MPQRSDSCFSMTFALPQEAPLAKWIERLQIADCRFFDWGVFERREVLNEALQWGPGER